MKHIEVTFHMNDTTEYTEKLGDISMKQAYEFAQDHARAFNNLRIKLAERERVIAVSIKFPIE